MVQERSATASAGGMQAASSLQGRHERRGRQRDRRMQEKLERSPERRSLSGRTSRECTGCEEQRINELELATSFSCSISMR